MQGKLKVQISLLAVALCVVFGAMLAGCYGSGYTPESADDEQVTYAHAHYEHYEDACEADDNEEENVPSPPTEPTFEIAYEIEVESRTPGNPPGRFVFSDKPVEVSSTQNGYPKYYFPADTIFAFISKSDDALGRIDFGFSVYCDVFGVASLALFEYEAQLTQTMMGFLRDNRTSGFTGTSSYEDVYIGVYHPPWEYFFPPLDESSPPPLLRFELDNTAYTVNGEARELVTAPFIDDETGLTMLPAQTLADAFGYFAEVVTVWRIVPMAIFYHETHGVFWVEANVRCLRSNRNALIVDDCLFVSVFACIGNSRINRTTVGYVRLMGNGIYVWESEDAAREWQLLMN